MEKVPIAKVLVGDLDLLKTIKKEVVEVIGLILSILI